MYQAFLNFFMKSSIDGQVFPFSFEDLGILYLYLEWPQNYLLTILSKCVGFFVAIAQSFSIMAIYYNK